MNRYFRIRQNDGLIIDSVIWDGISFWQPQEGYYVLPEQDNPDARPGWRKIEGGWEQPPTKNHYWNGITWIEVKPDVAD